MSINDAHRNTKRAATQDSALGQHRLPTTMKVTPLVLMSVCFIVVFGCYNHNALLSGLWNVNTFAAPIINTHLPNNNNNILSEISSHPRTDHAVVDTRPIFVIHIGPHKTGTTFLQGTLSVKSADAVLDMDNFYYLGTTLRGFFRKDKLAFDMRSIFNHNPSRSSPYPALSEDFTALLKQMRAKNQSGILIHEALHKIRPEFVQVLATSLEKHWKVIVVEGYRPLHEWLVSRFNQFIRDEYSKSIWPDGTGRGEDDDDDDIGFPPNLRFGLSTNTRFDRYIYPFLRRNSSIFETSLEVWSKYFDDVRVVDIPNLPSRLDGKDPYLVHFMCEIVQGAANLCQRAPDLAKESDNDMSSSQYGVAYESLATWTWQMHLIDRRLDRKFVRDHIMYYHKKRLNLTALPVSCPPPSEMDVLWQWTLQTDERLFRTTYHHDQESSTNRTQALQASFRESAQRNKFCAVDPSILLHEDWKPLFSFLAKSVQRKFHTLNTKKYP